jgi:hypothetical protein
MRFSAIYILLAVLVAGCGKYDTVRHRLIGTWQDSSRFSLTLSANGDFLSSFSDTNHTVTLTYQGIWQVKEDVLMMTITNVTGTIKHETNGSIDRMRVIELDVSHLALENGNMTNYLER